VTTKAWFFSIAHANDANFRAWGSDLSAAFAEVGLVQTADTGQIDWATVTRPGISTAAGYEIWRYTDSTVFMKIEYGTGTGAVTPGVWLTVGTGSNGSGTLTGTVSDRRSIYNNASSMDAAGTSRQSFLVYKDGFFGFSGYRFAAGLGPWMYAAVAKTTNAAGVQDSRGVTVYWRPVSANPPPVQALNFQTNTVLPLDVTGGNFVVIPMAITSSIIGADTQCFIHWTALPLVLPNPYMATVISAEVPAGSTFSTTLVGTTPRTYVAIDSSVYGSSIGTAYRLAMLWE
jgi:hypothetical protein